MQKHFCGKISVKIKKIMIDEKEYTAAYLYNILLEDKAKMLTTML